MDIWPAPAGLHVVTGTMTRTLPVPVNTGHLIWKNSVPAFAVFIYQRRFITMKLNRIISLKEDPLKKYFNF